MIPLIDEPIVHELFGTLLFSVAFHGFMGAIVYALLH